MSYYLWRCPVEDCRNLHVHGKDLPGQLFEDTTPWCHGSDAPGRPGSHEPVAMERIEVVPVTQPCPNCGLDHPWACVECGHTP